MFPNTLLAPTSSVANNTLFVPIRSSSDHLTRTDTPCQHLTRTYKLRSNQFSTTFCFACFTRTYTPCQSLTRTCKLRSKQFSSTYTLRRNYKFGSSGIQRAPCEIKSFRKSKNKKTQSMYIEKIIMGNNDLRIAIRELEMIKNSIPQHVSW